MTPKDREFWIKEWEREKPGDTHAVHKGFASPEYWDRAAASYNKNPDEVRERRMDKTLEMLSQKGLLHEGIRILDIGCGTGLHAMTFARQGARVTALDFSRGMLDRCRLDLEKEPGLKGKILLLCEDWHGIDTRKRGWEGHFDLVVAFMSPGIATPDTFLKMMACAKKGCAIRSWAAKRENPIMEALWKKIMDRPLEDKPQTIFYKINLLFSMGFFPDVFFDPVAWDQKIPLEDEFRNQLAFFKNVSRRPGKELAGLIRAYLEEISVDGHVIKQLESVTATVIWTV
ncbi:SAM-dependent methyltransferase [Desulfospira joergensenii]|uniref:SAM-dependent methyltransferase n=1 Tax=Desulfospira joergensenii TaxID=53329 RepID=UPI000406A6FE|nr:class I SAM-dependent methyltransferase [Desulfospira joergensenii]